MKTEMTLKLGAKEWFVFIISMLLLTDIAIIFDLPLVRQVLVFLCFIILPGLLILALLRLNELNPFKIFLLSVGLSISFLMFSGLLLNTISPYLGILKPLQTVPLVIFFTLLIIIFSIIVCFTNREGLALLSIPKIHPQARRDSLLSPMLIPILFPFIAIFGANLMDSTGNNSVLIGLYFLIPAYVVLLAYLHHKNKISNNTYPVAILMIGISLLFITTLRFPHLFGTDVQVEYQFFQLIAQDSFWSATKYSEMLNSMLSVTLLPTVLQALLNVKGENVYRIVYTLIFSLTPLAVYFLCKKYTGNLYAFFASFFYMAQANFSTIMMEVKRQQIAIFFFALAIMVFFDEEINPVYKKMLFIIFMLSVVVSHYSTTYVFFILMFLTWFVLLPRKSKPLDRERFAGITKNHGFGSHAPAILTSTLVGLFAAVIFLWYGQITETPFTSGVDYFKNTFENLGKFFILESRSQVSLASNLGVGLGTEVPRRIGFGIGMVMRIIIGIGIIVLVVNYLMANYKIRAEGGHNPVIAKLLSFMNLEEGISNIKGFGSREFVLITVAAAAVQAIFLLIPWVSLHYNFSRLACQILILLSPAFAIGCIFICKYLRASYRPLIISLLLFIFILSSNGLIFQAFGVPHSIALNARGVAYEYYYISDEEVMAAQWFGDNRKEDAIVYGDRFMIYGLISYGGIRPSFLWFFDPQEDVDEGYIYLRPFNNVAQQVYLSPGHKVDISQVSHLWKEKDKIYSGGNAEIYYQVLLN